MRLFPGAVDAAVGEAMSRGWAELVQTRLKGLVEAGARLGINPGEPPTIQSIRLAKGTAECPPR